MTRYRFSRQPAPRAQASDDIPVWMPPPTLMVEVAQPVNTGLIAPDGATIWRMPEPIGFPIAERDEEGQG